MTREFTIPLIPVSPEDPNLRLSNDIDPDTGEPIPHRTEVTGSDRQGSASRMAIHGRMPTVVHGFQGTTPHTLIIFEWSVWNENPSHSSTRFREVTITVSFSAHGSRRDANPKARRLAAKGNGPTYFDPSVVTLTPQHTSWYSPTTHAVAVKHGVDFSLKGTVGPVTIGPVTIGPRLWCEASRTAHRTDATEISGSRATVGPGHTGARPNAVRWYLKENASQASGIPAFMRTAVLVERRPKDNGQFVGRVDVEYRVSPFHDFREVVWKALGKLPVDQPIVFDPMVKVNAAPPVGVVPEKLGSYADHIANEFQLDLLKPLPASMGADPASGDAKDGATDGV
jgi:hypothetical protein